MSRTARRRRMHNAHERGQRRGAQFRQRPALVQAATQARTRNELHALVTDHAVVRWLERVVGIDVKEQLVRELLTQARAELISSTHTGRIRVNDAGIVLVIRNGFVVTVQTEGGMR